MPPGAVGDYPPGTVLFGDHVQARAVEGGKGGRGKGRPYNPPRTPSASSRILPEGGRLRMAGWGIGYPGVAPGSLSRSRDRDE